MRVLLAGGGSAGHIEPALALADALRRAVPDVEVTCLGTERGLETRLIPLRGYPLELIPAVPMPRVGDTQAARRCPGGWRGPINAAAAVIDRTGAAGARRLRRVRRDPRLPGGPAAQGPDRRARGQSAPGAGQPARRQVHHARLHRAPGHPAQERQVPRHPDPARDRRAGPAGHRRQGPGPFRPAARPARAAGYRRLAGSALAEQRRLRRGGMVQGRGRSGAARHRPAERGRRSSCPSRRALRGHALHRPDGPGLRGGGFRPVPGRRDDLRGAHRRGPAAPRTCRSPSGTASSG